MERSEFWAEHIRRREERGVAAKAYCAETGLSLWRWYYWRRKLKVKDLVPVGTEVSGKFVRVRVNREAGALGSCELLYPSGVRIRLNDLPPPSWVRQVV